MPSISPLGTTEKDRQGFFVGTFRRGNKALVLPCEEETRSSKKPPLCKGRWILQSKRRRDCDSIFNNNPSVRRADSSPYTREPFTVTKSMIHKRSAFLYRIRYTESDL